MTSTTLLFLPYDQKKSFSHDSVQSRQQHTALEYHRKRKLSKSQSRPSVSRNAGTPHTNDSATTPQSLVYSPGTSASEDSETDVRGLSPPRIIGKWRLDPFDALRDIHVPEYVQEMLDHAIRHQWVLYGPSRKEIQRTQADIMSAAMRSPVAFYSIVFAGTCHRAWLAGPNSGSNRKSIMLRMSYKAEALASLRKELAANQGPISEDLLLSINLLGVHDSGDRIVAPQNPMEPPLHLHRDNEFYSSMRWQPKHLEMVYKMVQQLGGLGALKTQGLAEALESTALNDALLTLETPKIDLLNSTQYSIAHCEARWDRQGRQLYEVMSQRKLALLDGVEGREVMHDILDNMRKLVVTYECFRRDNTNGPDLLHIIAARRSIQHNLLCPPVSSDCRYLVCRYAILIFLVETVYPKPRHVGIHRKLAEKLMLALDESSILGYWDQQPEAFAWAGILGGAAASDTPLYSWARRIKCDEGKPSCARCLSSGRKCGGYHQHNHTLPELGTSWERHSWQHSWTPLVMATAAEHAPLTKEVHHYLTYPRLLVFDSKVEGQSFDFFRSYSVPELTALFRVDEEFWHLSVLQLSMTQPAVRYAVTGLGALHQKFSNGRDTAIPDDSTDSQIQFALRQCNRAIHALSDTSTSQEPVHKVATLITCILFTCYATLQGHQTQSIMHFRNGMKLFCNLERTRETATASKTHYDELYNAFVLALTTLEIQARSLMCDENLPAFITQSNARLAPWPLRSDSKLSFKTLADARCYFDLLLSDLQCFLVECDGRDEWTRAGHGKIAFESLQDEQRTRYDDRDRKTILVIQLHNCIMDMYLSIFRLSSVHGDLVWDLYETSFRTVVDISRQLLDCDGEDQHHLSTMLWTPGKSTRSRQSGATKTSTTTKHGAKREVEQIPDAASIVGGSVNQARPVFTFSQGVAGPLYTVASKCRDPRLRREAVVLLLRHPRREGLWDTFAAGRVSWEIMNLEEELAREFHRETDPRFDGVKVAADVPVSCRVREVEFLMAGPRTATLRFKTGAESERGEQGKHLKKMSW
ncbi:hypothetical protein PV08_03218 [Exophiala spinifera]|uniref:Zn(2)-C6 fungal-type domain-containing protein n=1 Tax=Exophiala spinifera TaxID=91928 RepID=A0A0D2C5V3_9EURO|nr:uncharacterized protein PV08_03218 [Exophiala spinifera]KIW18929.1 hypothetical protein PV08_03218 [Exophiala spinifera]